MIGGYIWDIQMHVDVVVSDVEVRSGTASFGVMSDILCDVRGLVGFLW